MKNVLVFIMDDQTPETINFLGNDNIKTPNLDKLAKEGSYFRPYTTCPVCTPARAEFLTGVNAFNNGCRWFGEPIKQGLENIATALSKEGYYCAMFGKWHNDGHPKDRGFDETKYVFPHDLKEQNYDHTFVYQDGDDVIQGHSTEVICSSAMEFLENTPKEKPWFCYVALHSPHDPRIAPEPYGSMYFDKLPPLPDNFMPEHPFDNGDMLIRDERLASFPRRQNEIRRHRADYYGMITHHDEYIGRTLSILDQQGLRDNTLVIFTSDHGLAIGSHGLMGKENLYEHSARVPLIWQGKDIPKGKRFDKDCICGHYDFMPTLFDYLGLNRPDTVEGVSYYEVLKGKKKTVRESITAAYRDCMRMATDGRYKIIYYPHIERYQLFDLKNDPEELNDLLLEYRRYPESRSCPPPLSKANKHYQIDPDPFKAMDYANPYKASHPLLNPKYIPKINADETDKILKRLQGVLKNWQMQYNDALYREVQNG